MVGSYIEAASLDTNVDAIESALKHSESFVAEENSKTNLLQTMAASHDNLLELFYDPALEELIGSVDDVRLDVDKSSRSDPASFLKSTSKRFSS